MLSKSTSLLPNLHQTYRLFGHVPELLSTGKLATTEKEVHANESMTTGSSWATPVRMKSRSTTALVFCSSDTADVQTRQAEISSITPCSFPVHIAVALEVWKRE
jgi:hypothetical protein